MHFPPFFLLLLFLNALPTPTLSSIIPRADAPFELPQSLNQSIDESNPFPNTTHIIGANQTCPPLRLIAARGTNEVLTNISGMFLEPLIQRVVEKIPSAEVYHLPYWADAAWNFTSPGAIYMVSSRQGYKEMQMAIEDSVKYCPQTKIALFGYSQGGQVVLDAMCGGGSVNGIKNGHSYSFAFQNLGPTTPPLKEEFQAQVIALLAFGDPTSMKNEVYERGSFKNQGRWPRQIPCPTSTIPKIRAWCDEGDIFCDLGNDATVHTRQNYEKYFDVATDFLVERFEA